MIAELLDIPAERFEAFLGWTTDIGLRFTSAAGWQHERIEVACLHACCDELTALRERRCRPCRMRNIDHSQHVVLTPVASA
jgi:hypothetical protein